MPVTVMDVGIVRVRVAQGRVVVRVAVRFAVFMVVGGGLVLGGSLVMVVGRRVLLLAHGESPESLKVRA